MFQRPQQSRMYEKIVEQIQEAILSGEFNSGEMLPSQRDLCEMFQTSRATLREALRVLEEKGLIEMKLGINGGTVVKKVNLDRAVESLAILIRYQKVSLNHLMEFRVILEGAVTERACVLATKKDVQQLKGITNRALALLQEEPASWEPYLDVDSEFHMTITRIAGNPLFETTLKPVYDNIHTYFRHYLPDNIGVLEDNCNDICQITEAIEEKDPARAKRIAVDHVKKFNLLMEKREPPLTLDNFRGKDR